MYNLFNIYDTGSDVKLGSFFYKNSFSQYYGINGVIKRPVVKKYFMILIVEVK